MPKKKSKSKTVKTKLTKSRASSKLKSNANSMIKSTIKSPVSHVRYGFICLLIGWSFALLPVPVVSYIGTYIFNAIAFILAIVCFFKGQIKSGIILLVSATFGTLMIYLIGLFIMGTVSFASWSWLFKK